MKVKQTLLRLSDFARFWWNHLLMFSENDNRVLFVCCWKFVIRYHWGLWWLMKSEILINSGCVSPFYFFHYICLLFRLSNQVWTLLLVLYFFILIVKASLYFDTFFYNSHHDFEHLLLQITFSPTYISTPSKEHHAANSIPNCVDRCRSTL